MLPSSEYNLRMRSAVALLIGALLAWPVLADNSPSTQPATLCASSVRGAPACEVNKRDMKSAKAAFQRGIKLQNERHFEEAFEEFETASNLVPHDVEFATAREVSRQQLVYGHIERGNAALENNNEAVAMAEFRTALNLDPHNEFAQQRLKESLGDSAPSLSTPATILADAGEVNLEPQSQHADFHFRGNSRDLLIQIAQAFGVKAIIDDSVAARNIRFDIQDVDFYTAIEAACQVTKTFWTALDEKQMLLAGNTPENHRQYDRMAARTFLISNASSPQELNDVANALRNLFEIRFLSQSPAAKTITVRAPQNMVDAATAFIEGLDADAPQVLLDVKLYQVSKTFTRDVGLHIPNNFQLFNIPVSALAALGGQNLQSLINQLIANGGINQANSTALSALLAQLQNQQNSIFSQPLATFGNGKTLFGLSLDQLSATLSLNSSAVTNLEHATLRAEQGKDVNFRLGSRYPILNASFAPIFNTPAIANAIGNNSFQAAFPSFNYEDLGLTIKAKPHVHGNSDIGLDLEFQLRALGGTSLNGVPIINNREYKGAITLRDGEPAVVTGIVSRTEVQSMTGVPGIGFVPGLNQVANTNHKEEDDDELLVVITPHLVSSPDSKSDNEVEIGAGH
jgi:general secretion pathway protein D